MKKFNFLIVFAVFSLVISNVYSGDRSNARSTGMAFSTMVSSMGINANGINPANYDYHNQIKLNKNSLKTKSTKPLLKSTWELSPMSIGGGYGSDSSIEFYNNYLKYLSIDRNQFVNLFTNLNEVLKFRQEILPGKKTDVNYDFELQWLAVNYIHPKAGAFSVSVIDKVGLNTDVNSRDEYLPLTFGYVVHPDGKYDLTNVNLAQSEAIAWWIRKYNIGYAKEFVFNTKSGITKFAIGFSAGLVQGFGNVSTYETKLNISNWGIKNNGGVNHIDSVKGKQDFHTQFALTDFFRDYRDGTEEKFDLFPKPAGTGYSLDFGITMQIGSAWKIAASVTEFGKITWDYNTVTNDDTNHFAYYNFNLTPGDPTYEALVDDLGGYNTQDTGRTFVSDMPTKIRAGIMFQPSERLLVEFDWTKGTNNLPGNTDKNIFSLGAEYCPAPYLPLRSGVSIGGPGDFYVSLGAGIKFKNFTLDLGTHGINQLFADKRFSVAFSGKIIL